MQLTDAATHGLHVTRIACGETAETHLDAGLGVGVARITKPRSELVSLADLDDP